MEKLKLNKISLQKEEMTMIRGGWKMFLHYCCGCACRKEGKGGSSTGDNNRANTNDGLNSPGTRGCNVYRDFDGSIVMVPV